MERRAVRVEIRGRVQRVGFRAWTERRAQALGLDGWVRNREDGAVEAVFAGSVGAVERMLAICADGPRHARVEAVKTWALDDAAVVPGTGFRQHR